ncbi:multicopper oxidase family protein [Micromonospora sp. MS34]|uniref:multicopper oxidase family protein n=1 Tax=Micromonospora sp. MS34 TaxID=3385971 RepID=UPI0039A12D50
MATSQLIALDLVSAAAAVIAWLAAGALAAARQARAAIAITAVATLVTALRFWPALALSRRGWWFAQEKLTLSLPLLAVTAAVAVAVAGPRLVRAGRPGGPARDAARPAVVVSLLTAGYAAAAGLVVTFLLGSPVTLADALIAVTLLAAGTFVTWQVVAPNRSTPALVAGMSVVALGLAGVGLAAMPADPADAGGGPPIRFPATSGRPVTALRGAASDMASGGTVRRYTLTAQKAVVTLSSGRQVDAWTFNGQAPGPALTAVEGDLIEVTLRNRDVERGVTLHWHGYDVPPGEDGAAGLTQDAVLPGREFVYRFAARQAGTYWYHTHQVSYVGVRKGLYGTLVVTPRAGPPAGLDLSMPVHTFGDVTVLGRHDQPLEQRTRPGTPTRLRLINTDNTPHRFTLSGTGFRLAAVDGRDLNQPGQLDRTALVLAAGGRYDLVFTMPTAPVLLLVDDDPTGGVRLRPDTGAGSDAAAGDTSRWKTLDLLSYGTPAAAPFDRTSHFDRRFTMVLNRNLALVGSTPTFAQTVNGRAYPSIPTQVVRENDLVLMTIVNRGQDIHPWHLHGHAVRILSRDGRAPTGSPLLLDSFDVLPGEVWEVGFRATNPGLWMNHCHNLSHFEQGMGLHLAYAGITDPVHGSHNAHG